MEQLPQDVGSVKGQTPPAVPKQTARTDALGAERKITIGGKRGIVANATVRQNLPATAPAARTTPAHEIKPQSGKDKVSKVDHSILSKAEGLPPELAKAKFDEMSVQSKAIAQKQPKLRHGDQGLHAAYSDVPCIEKTAVQVGGRYLHANTVALAGKNFIACAAPVQEDRELFWQTVLEHESPIFDLSDIGQVAEYFPENQNETLQAGRMSITCKSPGPPHVYLVRDTQTGTEKEITRVHYTKWPDHKAISVNDLEKLLQVYDKCCPTNKEAMVHCRAGIGRTGTFIVALAIKELYDKGQLIPGKTNEAVFELVMNAREQRGPGCVQVAEQLALLCDYAYKLAKSGPAPEADVATTLFDPRKISNAAEAIKVIHNIATGQASHDERSSLQLALKIITKDIQSGTIKDVAVKKGLEVDLNDIRKGLASKTDATSGYVVVDFSEDDTKVKLAELSPSERSLLNFSRMLLGSKIPAEVAQHPNYVGTSMFTLGFDEIEKIHLPEDQLASTALSNACNLLAGARKLDPSKIHFVLTASTSASGPDHIQPFTLRCIDLNGNISHKRLVYNQEKGWQQLGVIGIGQNQRPDYNGLNKAPAFPSLDTLISQTLAKSDTLPENYVGLTEESVTAKMQLLLGGSEDAILVPDILFRGLCSTANVLAEACGAGEPFIVPTSVCSRETLNSCIDSLLYKTPLTAPSAPENWKMAAGGETWKKTWLKEASQLSDFLGCAELSKQLAPQRIKSHSGFVDVKYLKERQATLKDGEFLLAAGVTNPLPCTLYVQVGDKQISKIIESDSSGAFRISGSKITFSDPDRLISAVMREVKLGQLLSLPPNDANLSLENKPNKRNYPMSQHEAVYKSPIGELRCLISLETDGTFKLNPGPDNTFATVQEIAVYMKEESTRGVERVSQFKNHVAYEPGISIESAKELLVSRPLGQYILTSVKDRDLVIYTDPANPGEVVVAGIKIDPSGFKLADIDKKSIMHARDNTYRSIDELVEGEFPNREMVAYKAPIKMHPAYHENITSTDCGKLLESGTFILRPSTDKNGYTLSFMDPKTKKITHIKIEANEEGIKAIDGKTWYKTPQELLKKERGIEFQPLLSNKFSDATLKADVEKMISDAKTYRPQALAQYFAQVWLSSSNALTPDKLLKLVEGIKGVRLPARDGIIDEAITIMMKTNDFKALKHFSVQDLPKALNKIMDAFIKTDDKTQRVILAKVLLEHKSLELTEQTKGPLHQAAVESLRQLISPDCRAFASHKTLNATLAQANSLLAIGGALTREEQAELRDAILATISERRPPIELTTPESFALDEEFKETCTELWKAVGLGDFSVTWSAESTARDEEIARGLEGK